MARTHAVAAEPLVNVPQAKWVMGVLALLIAVVGKGSVLGLVLRQARFEILSLVRDGDPAAERSYEYN
jgi:hypothetical protein